MGSEAKSGAPNRREFIAGSAGAVVGGIMGNLGASSKASPVSAAENARPKSANAAANSGARRIIIDTDPGTDDAMAILLAFRSPELQVEAITPVSGNVPLSYTLPNALKLVEIAGRTDVPVAAGAALPLVRKLLTAEYVHGENGLGGVQFPEPKTKPAAETAPDIIRRLVRSHPGEITIVAIGPLTNIALALRADAELAPLIPQIVLMGGSLSGGNMTPAAEFNFYVDPEAARAVFHAGIPITMVGLDVTQKVVVNEKHIAALEAGDNPSSIAAGRIMRATMDHYRKTNFAAGPNMHDPLALATLLDPSVVKLVDYYVEIETTGELTAGESLGFRKYLNHRSAPIESGLPIPAPVPEIPFRPNAKVAMEVDSDKFFRLLIGRLTGHPF
jgi:purine nucleosidase